MSNENEVEFSLTVVRVGAGGDTDNGKYFYSFDPELVIANEPGRIVFRLNEDSSDDLHIRTVVSNASHGQLGRPDITHKGRKATVENYLVQPELINFAVIVVDGLARGEPIICDPQVLNVPD